MKTTLDKPLTLKELPEEERPREKLLAKGPAALSNVELLAILLRTGTKNQSVMRLAEGLLAMQDGLAKVSRLTAQELSKIKGIGAAKAVTLVAAMELGKRLASLEAMQRAVIRSPQDIRDLMMPRLRYETKEHFVALLLSTKNHVLAMPVISVGSLNASLVHPRELFREAINHSAAAVILVHNHPSGDPTPSREDIEITGKMVQAGEILGIAVLDHVIIGDGKYVSLKEKGII
ncbi:DNA repair protein RadC [Thermosinus carboxydivorans Nor1]|uniref:DNA repair protein RadC n=1 Tax=Thermosinus carboxydivorans Nor1 TaxID=401526 RepID=A1HP05_9FIRM|nr:DNA repair protein RadC [Thermosinus carboxydivorans]EAX48113.1 DNA repair protein RadC [Thermosinus carboxydivorans Nor1]